MNYKLNSKCIQSLKTDEDSQVKSPPHKEMRQLMCVQWMESK